MTDTIQVKYKILKMRPELMLRKWNRSRERIVTARDTPKGSPGEVFYIVGYGYWLLISVSNEWLSLDEYCSLYCWDEGFSNPEELKSILKSIYPESQHVYSHVLVPIKGSSVIHNA